MSADRSAPIDGLRALAALTILAFHLAAELERLGDAAGPWLVHLNIGVPIFFVLSGFLLYRPMALARLEGRPRLATGPYLARRALRIGPAYWVALPVVAILLSREADVFSLEHGPVYFLFGQVYGEAQTVVGGIGQAWTLSVEVAFYAFLPLWALALRALPAGSPRVVLRQELGMLALLLCAGVAWKVVLTERAGGLFTLPVIWPPGWLDHFALGMALAVLSAAGASGALRGPRPGVATLLGVGAWTLALAGWVILGAVSDPGIVNPTVDESVIKAVIAGLLVAPAALAPLALPGRLLAVGPLRFTGTISYGVYLWHLALVIVLIDAGLDETLGLAGFVALALVASLIAGWLSWVLVERHAIAIGRRAGRTARAAEGRVEQDAQTHAAP